MPSWPYIHSVASFKTIEGDIDNAPPYMDLGPPKLLQLDIRQNEENLNLAFFREVTFCSILCGNVIMKKRKRGKGKKVKNLEMILTRVEKNLVELGLKSFESDPSEKNYKRRRPELLTEEKARKKCVKTAKLTPKAVADLLFLSDVRGKVVTEKVYFFLTAGVLFISLVMALTRNWKFFSLHFYKSPELARFT